MTAGHPVRPGGCADCGTLLDSARKTYCAACKRERRRAINSRSDQKRRQRDRDLRQAAASPPGPAPSDRLPGAEREAVLRALSDLYAAVLQHTEQGERLREAAVAIRGDNTPQAKERHLAAARRMRQAQVVTCETAEKVVRRLDRGDAAGLLPTGRPPLPAPARADRLGGGTP